MLHAIYALGLSQQAACGVASAVTSATATAATTPSTPSVVGVMAKTDLRDSRDHGRGSRDSGLNDVGAEWSSTRSPPTPAATTVTRTSYSPDLQQATPERLARVQQQVRQHMQQDEEHYQQPKHQHKSVRDLLGHFEAQRRPAGEGVGPQGPQGVGKLGAQRTASGANQNRSYGFGSTTAVKNALRKTVSQPQADAGSNNNVNKAYSTSTASSHNSNRVYNASSGAGSKAYSTGSNNHTSVNNNPAPAAAKSNGVASTYSNTNSNSNGVNNKVASGVGSNASRRSFLDSIIAGAASADGSGKRSSRRSSATMEEVNNILNAAPVTLADEIRANVNGGVHHPVLRKAASAGGLRGGRGGADKQDAVSAPPSNGGSVADLRESSVASSLASSMQDIPSIVDQLPDDDRPQESRRTTSQWDPSALVAALYSVPEPLRDKPRPVDRVNVEGFLERLPSGRTKATFWNAWKRCYFRAKDGFLYCYAGKHSEKPMDVTQLMGGLVEPFESMVITAQDRNPATVPVIGIDDRMGHYVVVRASTPQETDRWVRALQTHTVEDFSSTYVQPWPMPRAPALLRDSIVVDLGSRSVRAGILCTQPSLPQVFFPAISASRRGLAASLGVSSSGDKVYGNAALQPGVRANSNLSYPLRPTERINKHTMDLAAVSGILRVVFQSLSVDPHDYGVVLSVPRTLDAATQSRLVADLFDRFGVRSVLLSHQTVLALYAYNAASGVVVDVGERTDVVPIMDGYIVEGGVSRVPYGGEEMSGHVRRFLLQRAPPVSLSTVTEGLLPRYALEKLCYVSASYRADLKRAQRDPTELAASVSVSEFFSGDKEPTMETLTLDSGRFQAPEGLFHPQAWGLDHPGVHRMVYKAIQECSMDARKTMARSVFLAGGLTMLPGFADRLREELAALLPPAAQPKVHASPYRYHAAYLGACVLANSSGVQEMCLTKEEYSRDGGKLLRPWIL